MKRIRNFRQRESAPLDAIFAISLRRARFFIPIGSYIEQHFAPRITTINRRERSRRSARACVWQARIAHACLVSALEGRRKEAILYSWIERTKIIVSLLRSFASSAHRPWVPSVFFCLVSFCATAFVRSRVPRQTDTRTTLREPIGGSLCVASCLFVYKPYTHRAVVRYRQP